MTIANPTQSSIQEAAETLRGGGVVAFPTETVYGLGCDTFNETGIQKVYDLKGRPKNNPTIAHIHDVSVVSQLTNHWDEKCDLLAKHFWPGPLTIIVPKNNAVPSAACGGFDTIAIRMPNHRVALSLLAEVGGPLSAPSANPSGYISPTTAIHVEQSFGGGVTVIDGGPCDCGIESTVLSLVGVPTVLRPGSVSLASLAKLLPETKLSEPAAQTDSPGTASAHYSPHTKTTLVGSDSINSISNPDVIVVSIVGTPRITKHAFVMPNCPKGYASKMYATLREADAIGAHEILIETPPSTPEWNAVLNRLLRATS
ncbi:MAG: threonylcarbamoyl-AMP synthase [Phycisphaerales bacterium]|nr:threonylcarbamoyl-AMP synthase [Phycisphaerales bacterium]